MLATSLAWIGRTRQLSTPASNAARTRASSHLGTRRRSGAFARRTWFCRLPGCPVVCASLSRESVEKTLQKTRNRHSPNVSATSAAAFTTRRSAAPGVPMVSEGTSCGSFDLLDLPFRQSFLDASQASWLQIKRDNSQSLRHRAPVSCLPACLLDAGDQTVAGHIAEANAADAELAIHRPGPSTQLAA